MANTAATSEFHTDSYDYESHIDGLHSLHLEPNSSLHAPNLLVQLLNSTAAPAMGAEKGGVCSRNDLALDSLLRCLRYHVRDKPSRRPCNAEKLACNQRNNMSDAWLQINLSLLALVYLSLIKEKRNEGVLCDVIVGKKHSL